MDLGELGARIKRRREGRGLKQADLAGALRVTPQAVSKWERGENAPDIVVLVPLMPSDGVIFSDGVEADALAFNSGAIATIGAARQRTRLVVSC